MHNRWTIPFLWAARRRAQQNRTRPSPFIPSQGNEQGETTSNRLAVGKSSDEILALYPYLEREDISAALAYAAWRSEETELPLKVS